MGNGSDLMKIVSKLNGPTVEMMSAAVESSHLNGIPATAHASWPIPYKQAVQSKVDSIQHMVGDSILSHKLINQIKRQGQFSIPTLTVRRGSGSEPGRT